VIQSTPVVPAASRAELAVLAACLLALAAPALRRVRWRGQTGSMQDEHGEWV